MSVVEPTHPPSMSWESLLLRPQNALAEIVLDCCCLMSRHSCVRLLLLCKSKRNFWLSNTDGLQKLLTNGAMATSGTIFCCVQVCSSREVRDAPHNQTPQVVQQNLRASKRKLEAAPPSNAVPGTALGDEGVCNSVKHHLSL